VLRRSLETALSPLACKPFLSDPACTLNQAASGKGNSRSVDSNICSKVGGMGPEQASQLQAQYARRAGPIGLTVEELDFEHFPSKNGFPGIPVKAWIRFPNCAELVDGEVYAWTAKAAEVTWKDGPVTYRTWVWSSAVTRREDLNRANLGEREDRDSNSK
jgi:hypothetical protein